MPGLSCHYVRFWQNKELTCRWKIRQQNYPQNIPSINCSSSTMWCASFSAPPALVACTTNHREAVNLVCTHVQFSTTLSLANLLQVERIAAQVPENPGACALRVNEALSLDLGGACGMSQVPTEVLEGLSIRMTISEKEETLKQLQQDMWLLQDDQGLLSIGVRCSKQHTIHCFYFSQYIRLILWFCLESLQRATFTADLPR
jgi:hypothetical protein